MKNRTWLPAVVVLLSVGFCFCAEKGGDPSEAAHRQLEKLDAAIQKAPDNPMNYYRRAQCLMKMGQYDRGYRTAREAMQRFIDKKSTLAWMLLEEIDMGTVRVSVRFNMGPNERKPPVDFGIVRPVSFIVHKGGLREVIDYEIGYMDGKPSTAAFGQMIDGAHANFGMVELDAGYDKIRKKAIDLIKARYKPEPVKRPVGKEYLNLRLPDRLTEFRPIVLSATRDKTIVARVAYVGGRRDVQVLEHSGGNWRFLGKRGRALTETDGNFLNDARQGPDSRLWVLVSYTRPSNPAKGNRALLYCYENGAWRLAEPPSGHRANEINDLGLLFIGGNEPVHYHVLFNRQAKGAGGLPQLMQWHDGKWRTHPAEKVLRENQGELLWNSREAWLICSRQSNGRTAFRGYRFRGPRPENIAGPFPLVQLDGLYDLWKADLSDRHRIALLLKQSGKGQTQESLDRAYLGQVVNVGNPEKPVVEPLAGPPVRFADHLCWSPKGELICTDCGPSSVRVFVLRGEKWTKIAEASQDHSEGRVFSPALTFRSDGTPIVTWEDFFPR